MTLSGRSPRRGLLLGAGAVVLVLVVVALVHVVRDDGDGLGSVRGDAAVVGVTLRASDTVEIELRPEADRASVLRVIDELPEEARWVNLKLGRVDVDVDRVRGETRSALIDLTLAVARVKAPAVSIEVSPRVGIDARVDRREQAAPLALEIAEVVPRDLAYGVSDRLRVEQVRSSVPGDSVVSTDLRPGRGSQATLAAIRASQRLVERDPRVSGGALRTEVRVHAVSVDDAAAAWRETVAALENERTDRELTTIYIDRGRAETGGPVLPVLSGKLGESVDAALALVRRLESHGSGVYATADRSFAQLAAAGPSDGRDGIEAAAAARVERFRVTWKSAGSDTAWMGLTAGVSRTHTSIDDRPDVARRLVDGVAAARAAGIPALHWDRQAVDGTPRLRVARPTWLPEDTAPTLTAGQLRRVARAIRSIGWPGVARFDVIVGRCDGSRPTAAVARITSTSTGDAREVESGASCTESSAVADVRQAWAASASSD